MAKITKHGGATIREFQSPAHVLRQRGKLGPYGGEARVETFTAVSEASAVPSPGDTAVESEPAADDGPAAGSPEPSTADIRAWARDEGYEVAGSGKLPAEIVDAYHEAHSGTARAQAAKAAGEAP